jgi:hypothetical protein
MGRNDGNQIGYHQSRMKSSLIQKLVRGGERSGRTTRFHDENDLFVGWREMRHLPYTLVTFVGRRALGILADAPWWPYPAIERIREILGPSSVVLEYGIGGSTLWMARRVARIYGIEGSPYWLERVKALGAKRGLTNMSLMLRDSSRYPERGERSEEFNEEFASLDGIDETEFDFVVVDGAARWRCIEKALPRLKSGGYLYLDDSDADKDWCHYVDAGQVKRAQYLLEAAAARGEGELERLRGLRPATPLASEGMLFRKR